MYELPAPSGVSLAWELRLVSRQRLRLCHHNQQTPGAGNRVPGKFGTNEWKLIKWKRPGARARRYWLLATDIQGYSLVRFLIVIR
jgi:hypothetical protein